MGTNPLRKSLLYGEYPLTIDDKNRLLVPAVVRKSLDAQRDGNAFFMITGINRKLWLYPERIYEALAAQSITELSPNEDLLEFDQMSYGMALRLDWDKQGRILIPEMTLQRAALNREVTMTGVRDHLELWNRDDWEAHREGLLDRSTLIALKARKARQAGNQVGHGDPVGPPRTN
jgi:MraZ protein